MVNLQWFSQVWQRVWVIFISKVSNSSNFNIVEVCSISRLASYCSLAKSAIPKAPIKPEISGLVTFLPTINSKARRTASL